MTRNFFLRWKGPNIIREAYESGYYLIPRLNSECYSACTDQYKVVQIVLFLMYFSYILNVELNTIVSLINFIIHSLLPRGMLKPPQGIFKTDRILCSVIL